MHDELRRRVESKFGSVNKLAKVIDIAPCDLYSAFNGNKPLYPKWEKKIKEALGEINVEDCYEYRRIIEILNDYWNDDTLSLSVNIQIDNGSNGKVDKTIKWKRSAK